MKKILIYTFLIATAFVWSSCQKGQNYPGGRISDFIPIFDLRQLYKGTDLPLTRKEMFGSDKITGIVVSDYTGNNLPSGYVIMQDKRRLGELRGIAVAIGADAAKYVAGDSVSITVEGGVLKRSNGMLQVTGLTNANVTKISSGNAIASNRVPASDILANPDKYESTLVAIVKGSFDPVPTTGDVYEGNKLVNDGFDNIQMRTETAATFAKNPLPASANFFCVVYNNAGTDGKLVPEVRMRKANDVQILSSTVTITPLVISGFINDVIGGDGNYEYVQLLATRDINFDVTPYSLVICNNAGAAVPTGFPVNGWAAGGGQITPQPLQFKSFKFNITTGTVKKGQFCYVGGTTKMINGSSSTSMASSNWVRTLNWTTTDGDGFGLRYSGLMANSGNAWGIGLFATTNVTKETTPIDCIFMGTGGSLFQSPSNGYRIANTDWYDIVNPITLASQPYNRQGSNTLALTYMPADLGYFYKLGGVYNSRLNKWVKARSQQTVILTKQSALVEIEGEFPVGSGIVATAVKD